MHPAKCAILLPWKEGKNTTNFISSPLQRIHTLLLRSTLKVVSNEWPRHRGLRKKTGFTVLHCARLFPYAFLAFFTRWEGQLLPQCLTCSRISILPGNCESNMFKNQKFLLAHTAVACLESTGCHEVVVMYIKANCHHSTRERCQKRRRYGSKQMKLTAKRDQSNQGTLRPGRTPFPWA